jgi:hypothetical protein
MNMTMVHVCRTPSFGTVLYFNGLTTFSTNATKTAFLFCHSSPISLILFAHSSKISLKSIVHQCNTPVNPTHTLDSKKGGLKTDERHKK